MVLSGYDMVFDTKGGYTLLKSFGVLRKDGIVVSVSGPPDLELAREWQPMQWYLRLGIRVISAKVRRTACNLQCRYRFMLMKPRGPQLPDDFSARLEADVHRRPLMAPLCR